MVNFVKEALKKNRWQIFTQTDGVIKTVSEHLEKNENANRSLERQFIVA